MTFDSIMSSKRRLNKIDFESYCFTESVITRHLKILKKFTPHLKNVGIGYQTCSIEFYLDIFNVISEVLELSLNLPDELQSTRPDASLPLKKFSKLKRLNLYSRPSVQMLETIPDDLLEELVIHYDCDDYIDEIQAFVNRQKKIVKLSTGSLGKIRTNQLVLKELTVLLDYCGQIASAAMFEKQHELRFLDIGVVNEKSFAKIYALGNLEYLSITMSGSDKSYIEGLNSLQNLRSLELRDCDRSESEFWPGSSFLRKVKLPYLQELVLQISDNLQPELFVALSQNMGHLRQLKTFGTQINLLPVIIENFQRLKVLEMNEIRNAETSDYGTVPSVQNKSLEKLSLSFPMFLPKYEKPNYDAINACPNLKRLYLSGVDKNHLEGDYIQRRAQLTHLSIFAGSTKQDMEESVAIFSKIDPAFWAEV